MKQLMDTLDYTGRHLNHGSKAIMLGLGSTKRDLPQHIEGGTLLGIKGVKPFCAGCLLLEAPAFNHSPELANDLLPYLLDAPFEDWPLMILVDDITLALEPTGFLWQVFTRFDPAHDIYATTEMLKHRLVYHGPILIDARMKPGYPGEVLPDEKTVNLVDRRWKDYGLSHQV